MFKKAKITSLVCAIALSIGFGVPALAAGNKTELGDKPEIKQRIELTEEQKSEFEAKRAEMKAKMSAQKEKWATLTDEQKAEIYSLHDQIADLQDRVVDKYVEFGVIDNENAVAQKERTAERKTKMRENGEMPMSGGFVKGGKRMVKGEVPSS